MKAMKVNPPAAEGVVPKALSGKHERLKARKYAPSHLLERIYFDTVPRRRIFESRQVR